MTVAVPDCAGVGFRLKVQLNELAPHPALSVADEVGSSVELLLDTLTVRRVAPLKEIVTDFGVVPAATLWLPPETTCTVGGAGSVTVTVTLPVAERAAPSTTDKRRCATPTCPIAGVIVRPQESVDTPHEAGANHA